MQTHADRATKLRARLAGRGVDALLVTDIANVFYLSGFTGADGLMLVTQHRRILLVDPRYTVQASHECADIEIREYSGQPTMAAAAEVVLDAGVRRVAYEASNLTVAQHRALLKALRPGPMLKASTGLVEGLRRVKDPSELALIRKAADITDQAFGYIVERLTPGVIEREIAAEIDYQCRLRGADKVGFDTIAAFGPNAACPHASPTDAALAEGSMAKLDFGACYDSYNADLTRTVWVGPPDAGFREIYGIVLDAQLRAIDAVRPGRKGSEIDAVARDYIASKGYGDRFGHGLGHGLGISVHDSVGFSKTSDLVLEPGMALTVEPGIYIEGWGGVRIEDDIIVTETGCEVITKSAK